jgi:anti-anti-sigma factor
MDGHLDSFAGSFVDSFAVECRAEPGAATICVRGEIDLATAPELEAALLGVDDRTVDLDLSGVTFCDACGLGVLDRARQRLGDRLRVRGSSAHVRKVARVVEMEWLAVEPAHEGVDHRYGDRSS